MDFKIKCDFCNKEVEAFSGKAVIDHVNICQVPSYHSFCSKKCRNEWCFWQQQKQEVEEVLFL